MAAVDGEFQAGVARDHAGHAIERVVALGQRQAVNQQWRHARAAQFDAVHGAAGHGCARIDAGQAEPIAAVQVAAEDQRARERQRTGRHPVPRGDDARAGPAVGTVRLGMTTAPQGGAVVIPLLAGAAERRGAGGREHRGAQLKGLARGQYGGAGVLFVGATLQQQGAAGAGIAHPPGAGSVALDRHMARVGIRRRQFLLAQYDRFPGAQRDLDGRRVKRGRRAQ